MIIDMHAHIVPEHFDPPGARASARDWPVMEHFEPGRARVMIGDSNFRTVTSQNWDSERRIEDMDREGVDVQVISPMPQLLSYWFTARDGLDMCRYLNEFIAEMVHYSPQRFHGLGVLPLQDPEGALRELSEVKARGLRGVEIGTNVLGLSLAEERFWPVFQEAERLDLSVFVHALHPTIAERIQGPEVALNAIGFPTETGLTIGSMIASGLVEAVPDLRLAFSHGGGTFAALLPRMQNAWSRTWNGDAPGPDALVTPMRESLPKSPLDYARGLYYDTLVFDHRAIRYLADIIGTSQLTVGTDYPFAEREQPVGKTLQSMGFTADELEDITSRNCLRFLGV
jgi:aminocarboxymuconate-semialdehyde decarboxylase